ncbi:MAG: glycosyltransferase family 39 protein [Chthoniobacteraceae bacterium]|nr:glycosyltransferase family 39 protein [Chthoniobacteraceae bacterium]
MVTDQQVQKLVYQMEEGHLGKWIRLTALLSAMVALFVIFIFDPSYAGFYKGLNHPKAMEQAQIAREIARGNGFSTKMIRPLAYSQFKSNMGAMPGPRIPDTYQAPLWPATLAPFLLVVKHWPDSLIPYRAVSKDRWQLSTRDYIYVCDRMISAVAMLFFFLSVFVSYFTVRRIFDNYIAIWVVILTLACGVFWQYALSGLPQMLMLFLFNIAMYGFVRAMEAHNEGAPPFGWLAFTAFFFGLLTLTHGIAFWPFVGAFCFCVVHFTPRWKTALVMSIVFVGVCTPWLVRNSHVCGNPFGLSLYSGLEQIRGSEAAIMRSPILNYAGVSPSIFRRKIQTQLAAQMGNLFQFLGSMVVAPAFFLSLLHLFKKPAPRNLRWALLSMWAFSVLGMTLFSLNDEGSGLAANNLHILFIPFFAAFGMAFIMVLWTRLEMPVRIVRYAFYTLLFGVCALPFFNILTLATKSPVQWPPYVPPYIAILRDWTQPTEIITADMPWAVAWYADRKSLWLPMTVQSFLEFCDYERLGGKSGGLYLTPVTGNAGLVSDIVKGDYKDWAPFILHNVNIANIKDFPLRAVTPMPIDNQCIFYSDRDRWTERGD